MGRYLPGIRAIIEDDYTAADAIEMIEGD